MANQRKVQLADGRIVGLTRGEITAIKRYVRMNGVKGSGPEHLQYDPGNVRYDTVNSLIRKGVFVVSPGGVTRFAEGVLA